MVEEGFKPNLSDISAGHKSILCTRLLFSLDQFSFAYFI